MFPLLIDFLSPSFCFFHAPVVSLICVPPALRADEQHPADEGPVGEDVWVDGSKTGEHLQMYTHTHLSCTSGF